MDYISSIASLPTDILILLAAFAVMFFATLQLGASKIISGIFALYIAAFLFSHVLFVTTLTIFSGSPEKEFINAIALFLVLYIPTFILLHRVIMSDLGIGGRKLLKASILSVLFVGLSMTMLYHIIPLESVYNFSGTVDGLFASKTALTAWLIIPIIALFF